VEDVYEMWNTIKQGINEADGKITGKEKTPQKNSFCDECKIILEDRESLQQSDNRKTRQNEQEYKSERKEAIKILRQKTRVLYKSNLEQMEIAYTDSEAKKFYQKVNSIRNGLKPQTLLIRDKERNIVSNKEKSPAKVVGIL
jgi:hypothetical protein